MKWFEKDFRRKERKSKTNGMNEIEESMELHITQDIDQNREWIKQHYCGRPQTTLPRVCNHELQLYGIQPKGSHQSKSLR